MKLKDLLESRRWETASNDFSKLPELHCGAFTLTSELGKYVLDVGSWQNPHYLGYFDSLEKLNTFLVHNYNYPPVPVDLEKWLHNDLYVCLRVENDNRKYGMPANTLKNTVRTVRSFDNIESKEDLLYEITNYVKQFLYNNYPNLRTTFSWHDLIKLRGITDRMIEDFTATLKYKAGEY